MAYHVAYLVEAYNIPLLLVVYSDQTNIHLVLIARVYMGK
jgi:hypothetical protein